MSRVDEGRQVEDAAARLNSSLLTLSRCNRVLWQARDEQQLLQSICQILVETAGVRLVWIGYCEDDAEKTIRPVARAGNGLDYLERVKSSWGNSDAGEGPVGDAIRTATFCWVDDIRTDPRFSHGRTEAMALGYVSCVALPLVADVGSESLLDLRGALTLYADAFDRSEIERYANLASYLTCAVARLRSNLADDVTYGVSALRTREDRKRAAEALRERAQLLDLTHDTIFVRDMNDVITFWNRGAEELYGWKSEQAVGKVSHQLTQTIFPARLEEINAELFRTGRWDGELIHTKRDGTQVAVASRWALQRDEQGSPAAILETNNDITERKRAEKEREQLLAREQAAHAEAVTAQHLVRDLVNSIEGIVWEADPRTFQFLFVSQQAQRVLGYPIERWLREPTFWKDHIHTDDREWAAAFCVAATADKRDHEFEYRMIAADGRTVWLRDLVTVVVEGDQATRLRGVMVDITERKQAETALRESEQRYRYIFETTGVSIWEEDFSEVKAAIDDLKSKGVGDFRQYFAAHPEFVQKAISMVQIVDVNDVTVKLFAAESKDELLASLHKVFVPETQGTFVEELIAIAEGHTSFGAEVVLQTLKGDRRTALIAMTLPPPPGRFDSVLVTITDITERKRAEYLTGHVFESSPDSISIVGRDYRFQRVNPVYEQSWGMPAGRMVGMHLAEILGREVFEQRGKPSLDRCFAGEEVSYAEWYTTPRGPTYKAITVSPLRPDSQRVDAALLIVRDLTEYMRASEALREAQTELAHVNRVTTMGQLAASIAHEVSQPIAATVTNADAALRWLAGQPPDLEEVRQALNDIIKDGIRAGDVIGRIRALIKKLPPRHDRLDINEAITDVIGLTRSEVQRNGVSLQTRLANGLPLVRGDRIQLQQVILNFIVNAVEAMSVASEGARELLISTGKDASNAVLVAVRDSGSGLDPEDLGRLFDAFYTTKPSGMGMGLSICRSIIEAHGGRVWATANEPQGAVFQFTLPIG
jgi:PAS domain S-box-containing protein